MRAAPVWMRPEPERKVTLEDSDRRGLIQTLAAELSRQISGARVAGRAINPRNSPACLSRRAWMLLRGGRCIETQQSL